jgi:hypothetical protein
MKHLILISILVSILACEKESNELKNGFYMGTFKYDTLLLWESLGITNDRFTEYASGGVLQQKYPVYCLTKGAITIQNGNISFYNIRITQPPNKDISDCESEYLLLGNYNIEEISDSIISFWKISRLGKQEYKLKLYYPD